TRLMSATAIWRRYHDAAAICPALLEILQSTNDHNISDEAMQLLERMAPTDEVVYISTLIKLLHHEDLRVRERAVSILRICRRDQLTEPGLVQALSDEAAEIRRAAARALLQHQNISDGASAMVYRSLEDPDEAVRQSAVQIIARLSTTASDGKSAKA